MDEHAQPGSLDTRPPEPGTVGGQCRDVDVCPRSVQRVWRDLCADGPAAWAIITRLSSDSRGCDALPTARPCPCPNRRWESYLRAHTAGQPLLSRHSSSLQGIARIVMPYLQRKYIDLIHHVSSKWVNWDPPIPVEVRLFHLSDSSGYFIESCLLIRQVGAYGEVESETGELRVEGNIYDPEFQKTLDKLGLALRVADHPPELGGVEEDFIIASKGARRVDVHLGPEAWVHIQSQSAHLIAYPRTTLLQRRRRHRERIPQRTMAVRTRQTRRPPDHAQSPHQVPPAQRLPRDPLQSARAPRQVPRHGHPRMPRVFHVPLQQM